MGREGEGEEGREEVAVALGDVPATPAPVDERPEGPDGSRLA